MRAKRHLWTEVDIRKLRDLTMEGLTSVEIAKRMGLNMSQIDNARKRYRIPAVSNQWTNTELANLRELRARGLTCKEIAASMGKTITQVTNGAVRYNIPTAKKKLWTPEFLKQAKDYRNVGMTSREISRRMGVGVHQVERALYSQGITLKDRLVVRDRKEYPPMEKLLDFVVMGQEIVREFDPRQSEVFPQYKTDKWVGLVFQGDWHFESYKTNLRDLVKDLEAIGEAEDVFYIFNGDAGDWADIRFKGYNLPSNIVPIELRYELLYHLVSKIKNLLCVVAGCHDDWLKNRGFFDIIGAMQKKANVLGLPTYYLGYGGTVNLKVGEIPYRIGVYHKFGNESPFNDFHPCLRYIQLKDLMADVVAIAHRHDKVGIACQYVQHKQRVLIRSGSHQYLTDWAWKEGFGGAIEKAPMLLLNGREKIMRPCIDYKQGLEELKRLNKSKEKIPEIHRHMKYPSFNR